MLKNDLSVFEMEKDGFRLKLQKGAGDQPIISPPAIVSPSPTPAVSNGPPTAAPPTTETTALKDIVSPMVGTFFRAGSPDAPPFVDVGKTVIDAARSLCGSSACLKKSLLPIAARSRCASSAHARSSASAR